MDQAQALAPSRLARWFSSEWLRPLNDWDAIEDLLTPLNTTWSATRVRARVVAKRQEATDMLTLVLRPNARWPGFRAGQHVVVEAEINGRILRRRYSLTSVPSRRDEISITVKRHPQGKVSNWLHDHLAPGTILTLGAPEGNFVLPENAPDPLLMISAGSGVTPLWCMLQDMDARGQRGDLVWVQIDRDAAHAAFAEELAAIAARWPSLRVLRHYTAQTGRPGIEALMAPVPDHAQRRTLVCGPEALMAPLRTYWSGLGRADALQWERFGLVLPPATDAVSVDIHCEHSGTCFPATLGQPLLVQAEQAGLAPRYGCRAGICHACRYMKSSGTVKNLLTGEVSAEPDEMIQLCVSAACTDLKLQNL